MIRHAIILVGGRGTRLQPLTDSRPKPILPIVDTPFLSYQLAHLRHYGVEQVTFACGFMPQQIIARFGDGESVGMRLEYVIEPQPLGTGGAIAFAARNIDPQRLLVMNGDVLSQLDLAAFSAFHEQHESRATIALTPVEDPSRYGLVRVNEDGSVNAFLEKPDPAEIDTNLINAGTYILEPEVLASIAPDEPCSIERDVFPNLVGRGLHAMASSGYWNDIGTFASFRRANIDVLRGHIESPDHTFDGGAVVADSATIADDATINAPAWIGDGATIATGAVIGPDAVVGAGASIGEGARVARSVVFERAAIGREAQAMDAVLGEDSIVPDRASCSDGAVLAPGATAATTIVRGAPSP